MKVYLSVCASTTATTRPVIYLGTPEYIEPTWYVLYGLRGKKILWEYPGTYPSREKKTSLVARGGWIPQRIFPTEAYRVTKYSKDTRVPARVENEKN